MKKSLIGILKSGNSIQKNKKVSIKKIDGQLWFWDDMVKDRTQVLAISEIIAEEKTDWQDLVIFKNSIFGKVLALDGIVQTTEADEFYYHEAIAHLALFSHLAPQDVLIIGGGDGGVLREVLKHKSVKKVDIVDIDKRVIELSRLHLPDIVGGAFDDPRVNLVVGDGVEFVKGKENLYDAVIVDSPDPVGPAVALFKTDFYKNVYKCLKEGGIAIRQTGSPIYQESECPSSFQQMRAAFDEVRIFLGEVPTYGGLFSFVAGTKGKNKFEEAESRLDERFAVSQIETRWYSPAIHRAAMVLPPILKQMLEKEQYGVELIMDVYGCDYYILNSAEKMAQWAKELCQVIKMKPFGEPYAPDFGYSKNKTAGPSVVQLIETSSITGHFSPHWLVACVNIFTCSELDAMEAAKFTMNFFKGESAKCWLVQRGSFVSPEVKTTEEFWIKKEDL